MMSKILKNISSFLPLSVNTITWDDPTLMLRGSDWNFSTIGSWRIVTSHCVVCGCYDQDTSQVLLELQSTKIISLEIQSTQLPIDPVFTFSNGSKLEIFSTTYLEPWVLDFSSGTVYVASPSDPKNV